MPRSSPTPPTPPAPIAGGQGRTARDILDALAALLLSLGIAIGLIGAILLDSWIGGGP